MENTDLFSESAIAPHSDTDSFGSALSIPATDIAMAENLHHYSTVSASEKALVLSQWLKENKAKDILNLKVQSSCMDVLILLTASSARHARALADGLLEQCRLHNYEYLRIEGYQVGQWVLVDLNDVIVHIFQKDTRSLYNLEALWRDAIPLPIPQQQERHTPSLLGEEDKVD